MIDISYTGKTDGLDKELLQNPSNYYSAALDE
jgi:hypothetical protein